LFTEIPCLLSTDDDKIASEHTGAHGYAPHELDIDHQSHSFHELNSLLQPTVESVTLVETIASPVAVVSDIAAITIPKTTKKRSVSTTGDDSPSPKRRLSTSKTTKKSSPSKPTSVVSVPVKSEETPDPLSFPEAVVSMTVPAAAPSVAKAPVVSQVPLPLVIEKPSSMERQVSSSASLSNSVSSETDFKSIAQAAISSLIVSASTGTKEANEVCDMAINVDTSTAHIKALTGNNWVTACADNNSTSSSHEAQGAGDSKNSNRARRQNLTPDERARQNRDRNREHARNTRLRKKAYVEELKRTLTELVAQRDAADVERRQSAQREMEQREVRFRVIEELLKLRGRNESNSARWVAILEDNFTMTLPVTDFRTMLDKPMNCNYEQVINGASEAMEDASYLATFLQTLSKSDSSDTYTLHYECDRKNFFMDGCNAVLDWTARVVSTSPVRSSRVLLLQTMYE
jgi:hypothetical protein